MTASSVRVLHAWWVQTLLLVLAVIGVYVAVIPHVAPRLTYWGQIPAVLTAVVAGPLLRARERRLHPELDDPDQQ